MNSTSDITRIASQVEAPSLPPLEKWNPPFSGDLDMRIARDGTWYYLGSAIKRPALVKLFSTILLREGDDYFLITPVEKYRIKVDDAPFIAVQAVKQKSESGAVWQFETNTGDAVVLDQEHPMRVSVNPKTGEPSPYILVRKNLEALISRSVFYHLVDVAELDEEKGNELYIESAGSRFILGQY